MTQRASLTSGASPSVHHKYGETARLDIQAERKKGIVKDRWRMKENSIVSDYRLCSVLSSPQLTENPELDSARESGLMYNMY